MMKTWSILLLLALTPPAFTQGWVKTNPPPSGEPSEYDMAYAKAVWNSKTLVVFVACPVTPVPDGCISVRCDDYNGSAKPRVLAFRNGTEYWETYRPDHDFVNEGKVRQTPSPFGLRPGEVLATADDEDVSGGLPFLKELEPYETAKRTQHTFRRWSGYIGSVGRDRSELKWRVPGNLAGIRGWSSRLYRNRIAVAVPHLARQDPNDDSSAVTWSRNYPDGTVFADVLRNADGEVFEVRASVKQDGRWDRFIAYKNPDARPHGYVSPTSQQCKECHRQAGRSEYADAAIPGADEVFSDPIHAVESGVNVQGGRGTSLN